MCGPALLMFMATVAALVLLYVLQPILYSRPEPHHATNQGARDLFDTVHTTVLLPSIVGRRRHSIRRPRVLQGVDRNVYKTVRPL